MGRLQELQKQISIDIKPAGVDENYDIPKKYLDFIRSLPDFDLIMLISEIDQHRFELWKNLISVMMKLDEEGNLRNE